MQEEKTCNDCGYKSKEPPDFCQIDGDTICKECRDNNYVTCHESGNLVRREEARYVDSIDNWVHEDCWYDYYGQCESCDYSTHSDNLHWHERWECYYCEACYTGQGDDVDLENPPSATYRFKDSETYKRNKRKRFVGVECEVEGLEDFGMGRVHGLEGWGATSDGSLNCDGVEFIGEPMNGDKLYNSIDALSQYLRNAGAVTTKNCGLHIHVNAMDLYHQELKGVLYVARKIEPLLYAMQPDSRRRSNWCREMRLSKQGIDSIDSNDSFVDSWYDGDASTEKYHDSRYHGLNLHARVYLGTVEFRYHTGTINARKMRCWAEICTAIVDTGAYLSRFSKNKDSKLSKKQREMKRIFTSNVDHYVNVDIASRLLNLSKEAKAYMTERINKFSQDSEPTELGSIERMTASL